MNNHNQAEDSMEQAFATVLVIVVAIIAIVVGGGYWLVSHLLKVTGR